MALEHSPCPSLQGASSLPTSTLGEQEEMGQGTIEGTRKGSKNSI